MNRPKPYIQVFRYMWNGNLKYCEGFPNTMNAYYHELLNHFDDTGIDYRVVRRDGSIVFDSKEKV